MTSEKHPESVNEGDRQGGSEGKTADLLYDDVAKSVEEFTRKLIEIAKGESGQAGVARDSSLSEVKIEGTGTDGSAGRKAAARDLLPAGFDSPLAIGPDAVSEEKQRDIVRKHETIARFAMEEVHKDLKFTKDGSAPTVIPYEPKAVLAGNTTLKDIAAGVLGNNASDEQISHYSDMLYSANEDLIATDDTGQEYIPAGVEFKRPGQNREGAIFWQSGSGADASRTSRWQDGSKLDQEQDGRNTFSYSKGDISYDVTWNKRDLSENSVREDRWVTDPARRGGGYGQAKITAADHLGRTVVTEKEDGKVVSKTITDASGNVTVFKPERSGEFKGQTTRGGAVVDSEIWMTAGGRIYEREAMAKGGYRKAFEDGGSETYDGKGRLVGRTGKDSQDRPFEEEYKPGATVPHKIVLHGKDGSVAELGRDKSGQWHGTKKDKDGNIVENDIGIMGSGVLYTEKITADGIVRTREDGFVDTHDKSGALIHREGKDQAGRKYSADFNAGDELPHTYRLELKAGDPPVEFKLTADGRHVAPVVDAAGNKTGEIEVFGNGNVLETNLADKSQRVVKPDGTILTQKTNADGTRELKESRGADVHTMILDARGRTLRETFVSPARTIVEQTTYSGDEVAGKTMNIIESGAVTRLEADKTTGAFTGIRYSGAGFEKVSVIDNTLVMRDAKTDEITHAERFERGPQDIVPKSSALEYDPDSGTVSRELGAHVEQRMSFSPGRMDMVYKSGTVTGFTSAGEMSYAGPAGSNEAVVFHGLDRSGVHLKSDMTVTIWNEKGEVRSESLSPAEKEYLKDNPGADRRDLAEIHRRFSPDQAKIDDFYRALEKVDSIDTLSKAEREDLKENLMHHVANPREIYQGKSPTCNVAVLQREMAMNSPGKYADFVIDAIGDGKLTTADGREVWFDIENLKMMDSSGRDLASRIFQTASVHALYYPDKAFLNTESGVGEVRPISSVGEHWLYDLPELEFGASAQAFEGLRIFQIAEIANKVMGEEKTAVMVDSADELARLFEAGGGKPLTITVDGAEYPFDKSGPVGTGKGVNHVVTVTGYEAGPPARFYVQNQWGLGQDHSTVATALDAEDLYRNMTRGRGGRAMVLGTVANSHPNEVYDLNMPPGEGGEPTYDHVCNYVDLGNGQVDCQ